ncbi:MAG: hypothetical protein GY845_24720 [Planctomycetes bacterium]|nr:hypothetical protein [Planctomycetota bacterium]
MSMRERVSSVTGIASFIFGIPGLIISIIFGYEILTMPSNPNWVDEMFTGIGLCFGLISASLGFIPSCIALWFSNKEKQPVLWKASFFGMILCVSVMVIDLYIFSMTSD